MRSISILPTIALALYPTTVPAQTSPEQTAVIQAFLQFDCVMTRDNEHAVVAAMGLSDDVSEAVGQQMFAEGQFRQIDDNLVLLHPDCPNGTAGSASPIGAQAAVDWMAALSGDQAADVVAEIMTVRGCVIGSDEFGQFQSEVARAVGTRFSFNETALPLEEMDPFLDAFEAMMNRGVLQLVRQGRLVDGDEGKTLVGC